MRTCISFYDMDDTKRSAWRGALAAASVSLLVALPLSALAVARQPNPPRGTEIFERIIARLCAFQEARGNRVILVDPARCLLPPPPPPAPMLTVTKVVINDNGGTATTTDFALFIDGATTTSGVAVAVSEGVHTVTENPSANYFATFGGDCGANGTVTLSAGESKECIVTNNDVTPALPGTLIVDKVTEPSGSARVFDVMAIGTGSIAGGGAGTTTDAVSRMYSVEAGTYSVSETVPDGWIQKSNTCVSVVVDAGETETCTITNTKLATVTLTKVVINDNGGTATSSDFTIHLHQMVGETMVDVDGSPQPGSASGTTYSNLMLGDYHVAETGGPSGYSVSFSGDCNSDGTMELAAGESKSCTVTNDDNPPVVTGKLLINEVLYDLLNGGSQGSENENEWVEIFNGTNATIDLSGYMLHDNSSASSTIPSGTILGSGKYLVVTGSTTTASFWSIPGDAIVIVDSSGTIGNGLANGGDNVLLMAADDTIVDAVSWESDTSSFAPSVPAALDGYSIVRTSPTTDTDTAADWTQTATPTPGATS